MRYDCEIEDFNWPEDLSEPVFEDEENMNASQAACLERIKTLISKYETARDFCLDQSDKSSAVDMELRSKARIYQQIAEDLRKAIR